MQMTIEIPDDLARKLEPKRERLAEIIRRGLGELGLLEAGVGSCALAEEVLAFLSRGPQPQEIVAFRPSRQSVERIRELLDKNREGKLTTEEEAEMDCIQSLNHLFSLIKVHARQHLRPAS
jgi:predicted transcriptional regulator